MNTQLYTPSPNTYYAIFACGCFWGVQHLFAKQPGVTRALAGYTGGYKSQPSYEEVKAQQTGHLEAVVVEYNGNIHVCFAKLCRFFFEIHDPAQTDGQGPDIGSQYLSAIFYHSDYQRRAAEQIIEELRSLGHEVNTRLLPAGDFWLAEEYHQDYYQKSGGEPYCHLHQPKFPETNYRKARFEEWSEDGIPIHLHMAGTAYLEGRYVEQDIELGLSCLRRSAAMGASRAVGKLGRLYELGIAVEQDFAQAFELYSREAGMLEGGVSIALARCHRDGIGTPKDPAKAAQMFIQLLGTLTDVESKAEVQYHLGMMYRRGEGVERDDEKAFELLLASWKADPMAGSSDYIRLLSKIHGADHQPPYHRLVAKELGDMYRDGEGTPRDVHEASLMYWRASTSFQNSTTPNADAMIALGDLYRDGLRLGHRHDKYLAYNWYDRAREYGHPLAKSRLRTLLLSRKVYQLWYKKNSFQTL